MRGRLRAAVAVAVIVAVAATLRFARLSGPPMWLDEAVTALIAAGRGPDLVAANRIAPLAHFAALYDPRVSASFANVLAVYFDPRVQDLHPPTFHLLANLGLRSAVGAHWPLVARVRIFAALFGIAAVAGLYAAARQAFSVRIALLASALMAVSPLAVMLSRESRDYAMLLLATTLTTAALLAVLRTIDERRRGALPWALWTLSSVASLYVHYFALFSWVAHVAVIAAAAARTRSRPALLALTASAAAVTAAFVPSLPLLAAQEASPEQRWLLFAVHGTSMITAPYRIGTAWQTMLLGKAWDLGPRIYAASRAVALVCFLVVLGAVAWRVARATPRDAGERALRALLAVIALILVQFLVVMALRGKDYFAEVRYQGVYYPAFALVVAWALDKYRSGLAMAVVAAGLVNSVMVTLDVESWKAGDPVFAAERLRAAPGPALIVAGVASFNEAVVHTINFEALARRTAPEQWSAAFVSRTREYASVDRHADPQTFWRAVAALRPAVLPSSLLVHSVNMPAAEYRGAVIITSAAGDVTSCRLAPIDERETALDDLLTHTVYQRYACASIGSAAAPWTR